MNTQTAPNYLPEVRNQYENYPYPAVDPELERTRIYIPVLEALDRLNYFCFSGKKDFSRPFRVLIAGGGTGDAVVALAEQLRDCPAEIIYVDLSQASMEVAQARARVRGLKNITWIRDSLLNLPNLGLGEFDYINCSGVLHHLADPDAGLKTLASALKADGAMGIMLYAKYGRMAVYQMQELLRLLNKGETDMQARVGNTKTMLSALPLTNWFHQSPRDVLNEVNSGDIGIYDLLLHTQDRAYSIPELYGFTEKAGLKILQFFSDDTRMGNNLYNPAHYIKDPALAEKAKALDSKEQHALAELLNGKIIKHTFYTAKSVPARPSPDDLDMIPLLGFDIFSEQEAICEAIRNAQDTVLLRQLSTGIDCIFRKTPHMEAIFQRIDGHVTLRDIFRMIMDSPSSKTQKANFQTLAQEFAIMFAAMGTYNWLFLRCKDTSPVVYSDVLQARVPT